MTAAVEAKELTKHFHDGRVKALDRLDLTIEKGEVFGVIGPNGAGKTTFMSCLLGLLYPTSGSLLLNGQAPDSVDVHKSVGYLPERLEFVKWMSANELMTFHAQLLGINKTGMQAEIDKLLQLVELDADARKRKIKSYSRGMLQRIGMAQALLGQPSFLLLDEPSSGLDPVGVKLFRNILKSQKENGVTIVINSHQLDQLEKVCDRVAFIKGGKVQFIESMKTLTLKGATLVLRWSPEKESDFPKEKFESIVVSVGAILEELTFPTAKVKVESDAMSTTLIESLCRDGLAVSEAAPMEGRLESFFSQN
ncbi:MAG: ABC transporter ATP-binding protein [Cyanobacteria bacterium SZAS-4]|nr:ABC transporter ATP-binding protein [Cyanobacteria bacterium SZAS-4]